MNQLAQFIFLFLVGTTVLNFVIALAARWKTGNKEFSVLVAYWFSLFVNFAAIATFSKTTNEIALVFFFTALPTSLMAKMFRDSRSIPTNWPLVIGVQLCGMAISAALLLVVDAGFSYSLLPFIFTISWPWLHPIYDSLVARRHEAIWIEKAMAIVFITGIMSHFAFAFYRLDESAAWWGWSQSIAHYQCLSIFLPLLINHRRERNERRNLELALEKISGKAEVPTTAEIEDLYRSLELQIGQKEAFSRQLVETNRHLEEEREMNEILIKTISHDLANPLTVVSAYMDMMISGRIAPEDHEKIRERMRMNLTSAMDMIARIRKAIGSRSQAELVRVVPVDAKFAIQRLEMLFEERLKAKGIRLRVMSPPGELKILADENALVEHVLANLLSNAVKFSYENSEIHFLLRDTGSRVEIECRDFGVGLNLSRQSRYISTPGTKGEEGTGFGLVISGYFLRKFDAELKVVPHSAEGQNGTSFIVILKKVNSTEDRLQVPSANIFS